MIEEKLTALNTELLLSATLVEKIIDKCIQGLLNREQNLLTEVITQDEGRANAYESRLDELCLHLIAQFDPKARDLRTVLMIYKINKDLERMADHGVNIAESGLFLLSKPPLKPLIDIPRMAQKATKMLKDSIAAFSDGNSLLARDVCVRDTEVDQLWEQIFRELVTYMVSDPQNIERALHLIRISHNLERIADLSTNIAEDVIFIVEGKAIQHHRTEMLTPGAGPS